MKYSFTIFLISLFVSISVSAQSKIEEQKMQLPDVLTATDGKKIVDRSTWIKYRRKEVLTLFEDNVYGQVPKDFDSIRFNLKNEDRQAMNGRAVLKEIAIDVFRNKQLVTINLVLFTPSQTKNPSPVLLLINHRGKENTDPSRTIKNEFWPAEEVIKRGYGIAAFQVSDVAADNRETFNQGVLRLYPKQLKMPNGMKAISAWAWGAMRVMDYFEKDKQIDKSKVAVLGHSRGGKAALWAGAQDTRFTVVISNNSGESGAALSRHVVGESILDINTNFPHWFCDNYKKYNGNIAALLLDQHMLLALIAPRALYVASSSEDNWADPVGEFLSLKYAEPVFQLFGLKPLPVKDQPPINEAVKSSSLGYHIKKGPHGLVLYDWERFIDFMDQTLQ